MVKQGTISMLAIIAVLVLSFNLVSSAIENVSLEVIGNGTQSNPLLGEVGSTHNVRLLLNHSNLDLGEVFINWSVSDTAISLFNLPGNDTIEFDLHEYDLDLTLPLGAYRDVSVKIYNLSNYDYLDTKTTRIYFTIQGENSNDTDDDNDDEYNFCESGEKGDLEISDFYVDNLGFGDDEEWEHLDGIELVVEVYNKNRDDRINDVILQVMVLDRNGNDVTKDFEFEDEEIEIRRIQERDSVEERFIIKELPIDIDEGEYRIYIKAFVEDEEEDTCVSSSDDFNGKDELYHEIEVIREDDPAVYVRTADVQRIQVTCGQNDVEVTVPVYNFGSNREDRVLVTLSNSLLGISESQVFSNLRSGKRTDVTFLVNIPENLDRNTYDLAVKTYFDVDDVDEDLYDVFNYDESSDSLGRSHAVRLEVVGCKSPEPSMSVSLDSIAKVGEELVVKAIVQNNDNEDATFTFSVSEFDSWADLVSIEPQTTSISQGSSKEILIKLNPTESGLKNFKITAIVNGETYIQPVSINVSEEEQTGFRIEGVDNITLILIIGIVILIIIILLVLITRALKGNKKESY